MSVVFDILSLVISIIAVVYIVKVAAPAIKLLQAAAAFYKKCCDHGFVSSPEPDEKTERADTDLL